MKFNYLGVFMFVSVDMSHVEIDLDVAAIKYDLLFAILEKNNEFESVLGEVQNIAKNINKNSYSDDKKYKKQVCNLLTEKAKETAEDNPFKQIIAILDASIPNSANLAAAKDAYKEIIEDLASNGVSPNLR